MRRLLAAVRDWLRTGHRLVVRGPEHRGPGPSPSVDDGWL